MSRKKLIRNDRLPYHVYARANNRERFPLPLERMWELMESELHAIGVVFGVEIHSFVLMPNHYHLLVTVPQDDLGKVMALMVGHLTQEMNRLTGRSGHQFGGRYRRSLIRSTKYYANAFKYVYRNPVKGGLCARVEDYPYSTFQGLLGKAPLGFPIHLTRVGLEINFPSTEPIELLDWLNEPMPAEVERLIRKGLRRPIFDKIKDRKTRKPIELPETVF